MRIRTWGVAALALTTLLVGCADDQQPTVNSASAPVETVVETVTETVTQVETQPVVTEVATEQPTGEPGQSTTPSDDRERADNGDLIAYRGDKVELAHVSVELKDVKTSPGGIGVQVEVCYTTMQDGEEQATIAPDAWSFQFDDMEAGVPATPVPAAELEPTDEFGPRFTEKVVAVGECNSGWLGGTHGNPHLMLGAVRYNPASASEAVLFVIRD